MTFVALSKKEQIIGHVGISRSDSPSVDHRPEAVMGCDPSWGRRIRRSAVMDCDLLLVESVMIADMNNVSLVYMYFKNCSKKINDDGHYNKINKLNIRHHPHHLVIKCA